MVTQKVSLAQEAELRRLAEALHDQVLQDLALRSIQLDLAIKKREVPEHEAIRNLQRALQTCMQEVRNLCFDLSPPVLQDVGLNAAIQGLGERLARERGFSFVFERGTEELPLREDLKVALFRIAREILVNAAKHSGADRVLVRVCQEDGLIRLMVSDNGVGFEPGATTEGFGLANVKQRVRELRGELALSSAPKAGTTFGIVVPSHLPKAGIPSRENSQKITPGVDEDTPSKA